MKKIMACILAVALCISFTACSGGNKKAFKDSKEAYDNINIAYNIVEQMGRDICEAWRMGIFEENEIYNDGAKHLASKLSLSEEELELGAAYTLSIVFGDDWETISEEDKNDLLASVEYSFIVMKDNLYGFCAAIVINSYILNGKVDEAQNALDLAKVQLKDISKNYPDYEHYSVLKGYYTTTSSFFDFCKNPNCSYEQLKETISSYNDEARNYASDLDFIFE